MTSNEHLVQRTPPSPISIFQSIYVLTNTVIGIGLLSIPSCFQIGLAANFILSIVLLLFTNVSLLLLIDLSHSSGQIDYPSLMKKSFGEKWVFIPKVLFFLTLFFCLVAYIQFYTEILRDILNKYFKIPSYVSTWSYSFFPLIILILPLTFLRSLKSLSKISFFSLFLVFLLLFHNVFYFSKELSKGHIKMQQKTFFNISKNVIFSFNAQSLSYCCHYNFFSTLQSLDNPTKKRKGILVMSVSFIAFIVYMISGASGYLYISHGSDDDIKPNFFESSSTGISEYVEILYCFSLFFSIPLIHFPCRQSLHELFFKSEISDYLWIFYAALLLGLSGVVAAVVDNISKIFNIIGGILIPFIVYILPALFSLKLSNNSSHKCLRVFISCLFILFGVLISCASVLALFLI